MTLFQRRLRQLFLATLFSGFIALLIIFSCDQWVSKVSSGLHTDEISEVSPKKIAIVLGCSEDLANGRKNLYFLKRIEAAVELYDASLCQWIIVSGDNSRKNYNEPERMKAALIAQGIPEERVICDYAGFRTLDSIARARRVFQVEEAVIVTQPFHNQRALFLARHFGLDASGYDADTVNISGGFKTRLREKLARVKTVMDVYLLNTGPKFYGESITIGEHVQEPGLENARTKKSASG